MRDDTEEGLGPAIVYERRYIHYICDFIYVNI